MFGDSIGQIKLRAKQKFKFLSATTQGLDMVCKVVIMGKQIEVHVDLGSKVLFLTTTVFEELETDTIKLKGSDLISNPG